MGYNNGNLMEATRPGNNGLSLNYTTNVRGGMEHNFFLHWELCPNFGTKYLLICFDRPFTRTQVLVYPQLLRPFDTSQATFQNWTGPLSAFNKSTTTSPAQAPWVTSESPAAPQIAGMLEASGSSVWRPPLQQYSARDLRVLQLMEPNK